MIERLLTQTATVVHRAVGTPDSEGNPTPGTTTSTDYAARLEQTDTLEVLEGEDRVQTDWLLFLPSTAVVVAADEVVIDSVRYQVTGQPAPVRTPRGLHHYEARLRRVGTS